MAKLAGPSQMLGVDVGKLGDYSKTLTAGLLADVAKLAGPSQALSQALVDDSAMSSPWIMNVGVQPTMPNALTHESDVIQDLSRSILAL